MLAITQSAPGGVASLQLTEVDKPLRAARQLLIQVHAAGINRADLVQREGRYPVPAGASPILGLEISGVVIEADTASRFAPGSEVFGLVAGGGYAEYALLDEDLAIMKPAALSWLEAAALPEAWMTAWFNLVEKAHLQAGETALIHAGASGVGAAAIQLARLLGAQAWASAGSEEKLAFCQSLGAQQVFNYKQQTHFAEQLKTWGGVDVILDPVGGSYLADNVAALKPDGRLVNIGLMGGTQGQLNIGMLLMKRLKLIGSTLRSQPLAVKARLAQALEQVLLPQLLNGKLRIVMDAAYPLAQAQEAHRHVEANRNLGKVMLEVKQAKSM